MGEAQSILLSPLSGAWLSGSSAAPGRANSTGGGGLRGRTQPTSPAAVGAGADAAGAALATSAGRGNRGESTSLRETADTPSIGVREYISYRLGRSTFVRTPVVPGLGRNSCRFDFGVSLRTRRVSASSERTAAAPEAKHEEARKCTKDNLFATCDSGLPSSEAPDVASTPDGPAERELICPVCLELLWKPVVLECGHSFCFWCAFQCMNAYDVSRCPLCKSTFDKFPPVSRPLDLYLLRHFPRTTKQRDKEMEEFEFHKHRRSPCHSRIADVASGASTNFLPASQLEWLLEQKAPDLMRPAAAKLECGAAYGVDERERRTQEASLRGAIHLGSISPAGTPSPWRFIASSASNEEAQPSRQLAVRGNSGCETCSGAIVRNAGGEGGARGSINGERAVLAEEVMLSGRRPPGESRVRFSAYSELPTFSPVYMYAEVPIDSGWHAREGTSNRGVYSGRRATVEQSFSSRDRGLLRRGRRSFLRSNNFPEFEAQAVRLPQHVTWTRGGHRARMAETARTRILELQHRAVGDDEPVSITSLHHISRTLHGHRDRRSSESGGAWTVQRTGGERSGEFLGDVDPVGTQVAGLVADSLFPDVFNSFVGPPQDFEVREPFPSRRRRLLASSETNRMYHSADAGDTGRRQTPSSTCLQEGGGRGGEGAHTLEHTGDEWEEWDSFDGGDVSFGLLDPGELTTGHRRNPGDEALQPMDAEEEEVSGYSDAVVEEFATLGESYSTFSNSVLTEDHLSRLSDGDDEDGRSIADENIHEDTQVTEDAFLFEQRRVSKEHFTEEDFVHYGIHCDGCGKMPIVGRRHRCVDCSKEACGFDLCGACKDANYDKSGRFDQNHTTKHRMKLVPPRDAEWWIQSLNRMKKIHPELSVHQILQWIMMHYQEIRPPEEPSGDDIFLSSRDNGRVTVDFS